MNIVGPTRLVLLRAGKYDYGEVELINPLHLVGPNNIGKTSLIAVLQFLYIDDQRVMHFSREMARDQEILFPRSEQLPPVRVSDARPDTRWLGVQGLGPIRGYEFRRFAYQGQYDPDDYLDADRRIRTFGGNPQSFGYQGVSFAGTSPVCGPPSPGRETTGESIWGSCRSGRRSL